MNDNQMVKINGIESRIYTLRGVQILLDRDLANFYEVKPIRLREQVKRNSNRFPKDFMFQLTDEEVDYMVSQNAIPSKQHLGGALPYASLKDLGKKWFAFSKLDKKSVSNIINQISELSHLRKEENVIMNNKRKENKTSFLP